MQLHEKQYTVFVYKYIDKKNQWFVKATNFKKSHFSFLLFLQMHGFLEFWVLSRWRNTRIQAPRIQNPGRFRRFSTVQTSRSRGQHLCSKFAKIPHVGCARMFKVPTSSCGPPSSGITLIGA